jgi:hypothetical protein
MHCLAPVHGHIDLAWRVLADAVAQIENMGGSGACAPVWGAPKLLSTLATSASIWAGLANSTLGSILPCKALVLVTHQCARFAQS